MYKVEKIIIHCSDSSFGNVELIDQWHKEFGFDQIGYHFVIENGYPFSSNSYVESHNGLIANGRADIIQGAHCLGQNDNSIGICLIGRRMFTHAQLFISLPRLISKLLSLYELSIDEVFGHCEFDNKKTCPNIDMPNYRFFLKKMFNNQFFKKNTK